MSVLQPLFPRQDLNDSGFSVDSNGNEFFDGRPVPFWYTRKGEIIRWSVFTGLFFLFLGYMMFGYWHAKRRIRKGLAPLAYHRWLLDRETRMRYDPSYQVNNPAVFYTEYHQQGIGQYPMHAMPPPMYDPNAPVPPSYQPPAGGSKVDPSQYRTTPTRRPAEGDDGAPSYEPPQGPPPAALRPENTGASNNPYRV